MPISNGLADMKSHLLLLWGHYKNVSINFHHLIVRILIEAVFSGTSPPSSCCWGLLDLPDGLLRQDLWPCQACSVSHVCPICYMGRAISEGLLAFHMFYSGTTRLFSMSDGCPLCPLNCSYRGLWEIFLLCLSSDVKGTHTTYSLQINHL